MVDTTVGTDERDIARRIVQLTNEGEYEQAVETARGVSDPGERMRVLADVLRAGEIDDALPALTLNLSTLSALALARIRVVGLPLFLPLSHDFGRASARDLARDLDSARDLAITSARVAFDLHLASTSARALALTFDFELSRDRARDLVRDLSRARASVIEEGDEDDAIYPYLEIISDFVDISCHLILILNWLNVSHGHIETRWKRRVAAAIDECFFHSNDGGVPLLDVIRDVLIGELEGYVIPITLEGEGSITASVLKGELVPYVEAIEIMQRVHSEINGVTQVEAPRIVEIHNVVPKLSVMGIGKSLISLYQVFTSARQVSESKEVSELRMEKLRLEAELQQQRLLRFRQDQIPTTKEDETDARREQLEIRRLEIEIEREELHLMLEIRQAEAKLMDVYLAMADDYLKSNYPRLSEEERLKHVGEVARGMYLASSTGREFRVGWHEQPRNLPPKPPTSAP